MSTHRSPISRHVTEAFRISMEHPANILNSKSEFRANNLPELEIGYGTRIGNGKGIKRRRPELDEAHGEDGVDVDNGDENSIQD